MSYPAYARSSIAIELAVIAVISGCARGDARPGGGGQGEGSRGAEPSAREAPPAGSAEKSAPDTVVRLDSAAQRLVGIEVHTVGTGGGNALIANGTIMFDANHMSVIGPRVEGRLASLRGDLGQQVHAGAVLATVESPEVGQLRGELQRAQAAIEVARRNYEREQRLFREQITSQKELLESEGAYRSAQADSASTRARLEAVGAMVGEGAAFGLRSPVSGTIVERNASPGQIVGPSSNLFTVADLDDVWINVDVYENDLPQVRQGAPVTVLPRILSGEEFQGRVTYAGGVVDSATRTFKVRVVVSNPKHRLRPGMFAQVRIETPTAAARQGPPAVPEVAVQELEGKQVVFVPGGRFGEFIARTVILGPRVGEGMVTVADGLRPGDRVVTKGAFQLKAELTKASFGEEE
jgi:cobalt-zinc-cadmium efflux system membrane fusion protein